MLYEEGYLSTVKIGPKGQIVIPKEARDMLGLKPGDSLLLMAHPAKGIGLQKANAMMEIANRIFAGKNEEVEPREKADSIKFAERVKREAENCESNKDD